VSDKSEGPGWWMASDGKWYPPEEHPSFKDGSRMRVPDRQEQVQASAPSPVSSGSAAPGGRQFPDLFQKALQGSHLADNVTVKYDGDDERNEPGPAVGSVRTPTRMTRGGGTPAAVGTAGVTFAAAPAKRKWRKGR
jgi:hypothetical protein